MLDLKDILVSILFFVGIATAAVIIAALDSLPMFFLVALAFLLWIALVVIILIDAAKRRRDYKEPFRVNTTSYIHKPAQFFDQDESKEGN